MRLALTFCILLLVGLVTGCGSSSSPVVAGKLEGGVFWKNPGTAPSNEGHNYDNGSKVEVYEGFVVVTTSDGVSHVHPHGYYSGLMFKKD